MTQDHPEAIKDLQISWKAILAEWDRYGCETYCKYPGQDVKLKTEINKAGVDALSRSF